MNKGESVFWKSFKIRKYAHVKFAIALKHPNVDTQYTGLKSVLSV